MTISPVISEEYSDIIFQYTSAADTLMEQLAEYKPQIVNHQYAILHAPLSSNLSTVEEIGYSAIPKLFTFIDTVSLEVSGIPAVQLQPYLSLTGKGVLIGFLDSGIDYTHPAFRNPDGTTRFLSIWDQTKQTGPAPKGPGYGTEYTEQDLNTALFTKSPLSVVPVTDPHGHGTAAAGIACGSPDSINDFTGAAPDSRLIFVCLKEAKQYLQEYFLTEKLTPVFQETDLMLGIRYMTDISRRMHMPLILCMTLGSNQGSHIGVSPLENLLTSEQMQSGICAVTGTGNEAGKGHHFSGQITREGDTMEAELLIEEETGGFTLEFWADAPELYSIGFISPLGEIIRPVQPRMDTSQEFSFLLESSRLQLTYTIIESLSGSMLALMRFINPTPGIWRIRIENITYVNGVFHMWLPVTGLISPSVRFFTPDSDTTLVIPSCEPLSITVSNYNAFNNSIYVHSGRGFTRNGRIKPDFASPGVALTAPSPSSDYTSFTGSCAASALTSGAAALFAEAGLRRELPRFFTVSEIKSLFLRGTDRTDLYKYPNKEWGYGTMNVYESFESFLRS